jgi:hypothetical protein
VRTRERTLLVGRRVVFVLVVVLVFVVGRRKLALLGVDLMRGNS